jgi:ketosteroid isomerase-like protein
MTLEQQIHDSDAAFEKAYNGGDLSALETLHADDAMLLAPDTPITTGDSDAVVEGFRELFDAGWRNISLDSVEIESDGDLAYHVGRVGFDVPVNGTPERKMGKYVDIYKRGPEGWKIRLTIWNMDEPVPA